MIVLAVLTNFAAAFSSWEVDSPKFSEVPVGLVLSSFCNLELVLDNKEWWSYMVDVGKPIVQFHEDRKGLVQKANDPTPNHINLGFWNNSDLCGQDFTIKNKVKDNFQVVGRVLKSLNGFQSINNGWIEETVLRNNKESYTAVFKVNDYLLLLKDFPQNDSGTGLKITERSTDVRKGNPDIAGIHNFFYCKSCHFFKEVKVGDFIDFDDFRNPIKRVWENNLIELVFDIPTDMKTWKIIAASEFDNVCFAENSQSSMCSKLEKVEYSQWNPFCPNMIRMENIAINYDCFGLSETGRGLISFQLLVGEINERVLFSIDFLSHHGTVVHIDFYEDYTLLETSKTYRKPPVDFLNKPYLFFILYNNTMFVGTQTPVSLKNIQVVHADRSFETIQSFRIYSTKNNIAIKSFSNQVLNQKSTELLEIMNIDPQNPWLPHMTYDLLNGDYCTGYKIFRTVKLELVCGEDAIFMEIDEYSPCQYKVVLASPILCLQNILVYEDPSPIALLNKI